VKFFLNNGVRSVLAAAALIATVGSAYGLNINKPTELDTAGSLVAGSPVMCHVGLSGSGVTHIKITSNPPGLVAFEGNVTGTSVNVMASSSNVPNNGSVLVSVEAGGETVSIVKPVGTMN
jgi:hypothetical protein